MVELSRARHNVNRRRYRHTPGLPAHLDRLLGVARRADQEYGVEVRKYLRTSVRFQDARQRVVSRLGDLADAVDYAASYLKDAREQLCRAAQAVREMPEAMPVLSDGEVWP